MNPIRLSGVIRQSIVDGPGLRFVVFTQGCPHNCPDCHNPQTHDFTGGYDATADKLLAAYDENPLLKGITLSGGEPFCQNESGLLGLTALAQGIHARGGDVYSFSGYTFEELLALSAENPAIKALLSQLDILIDGRYVASQRDLTLRFRGSANQRIIDVPTSLAAGAATWAQLPN